MQHESEEYFLIRDGRRRRLEKGKRSPARSMTSSENVLPVPVSMIKLGLGTEIKEKR